MPRYEDEDGDTVLDDRLSDYDGDEERHEMTSGEAAAIREAEKNRRKIHTVLLILTFFTSLVVSTVKWYSRPAMSYGYNGSWDDDDDDDDLTDIFGNVYLDRINQQRLNQTLNYLLKSNISGHSDWLHPDGETTGTLVDLYDDSYSPQYRACLWISTIDQRKLTIPDPQADASMDEYLFLQRYVLAVLFFSTGGLDHWTYSLRFLTGSHECYWYDVFAMEGMPLGYGIAFGTNCDREPNTKEGEDWQRERIVTQIVMLPANGMEGTLPMELHHLHYLKALQITINPGIAGTIPSEYGYFPHLQQLALSYNSLEGVIPGSLSWLTKLEQLNLEANHLVGNTSNGDFDFLTPLKKLRILSLEYNANISGTLPSSLSDLSQLRLIALSNNEMSGTIPKSWSTMNNLQYLFLDDNRLSGSLDVLQNMTNLTNVYLQGNKFTGTIDYSFFSRLTSLVQLDISNNTFRGTLPSHFFSFSELEVLDMSRNQLTGDLPSESMTLTKSKLQHLALNFNNITGPIPNTIKLPNITHLDLSSNQLTRTIPSALGEMANLTYLFLGRNDFTVEHIPNWLQNLTRLTELSLKGLNFTGQVPDWIGNSLSELTFLDLGENSLYGLLPASMGNLTKLWVLILNQNYLHGTLPQSLAQLKNLEVLLIDDNSFHGNTSAMCNRLDKINFFVSDCASDPASSGIDAAEIQCECCTLCCHDENVTCNDAEWLGNHESMWESGYTRWKWEFESGSVSPIEGDR